MEQLIHWVGKVMGVDMSFFPTPPGPCRACGSCLQPRMQWRRQWWYCLVMTWWVWFEWFELRFGPWKFFPFFVWIGFKDRSSSETWFSWHHNGHATLWWFMPQRGKRLHRRSWWMDDTEAWELEIGPVDIRKYKKVYPEDGAITLRLFRFYRQYGSD